MQNKVKSASGGKKLKIGIIFGGSSSEKEVSLEGGRNVYQKIDQEKYQVTPIFVDSKYVFWRIPETLITQNTAKDLEILCPKNAQKIAYEELKKVIDFAFIIGHGKYMEDGCLQGYLELQRIPYNGPGVLGAALGMDKYVSRKIWAGAGINVPKYLAITRGNWDDEKEKIIKEIKNIVGYPCIVKPSREGCSTSIHKVHKPEEFNKAVLDAFRWDRLILVEEFLEGTEITISVLGNEELQVLPVTETPRRLGLDYLTLEDKFLPGGAEMITPARLPETVSKNAQDIAIKACRALNLVGYPRVDMFITKDNRIVVLEVNTLPGITPSTMVFHQAAEIDLTPAQFIDKIIELGLDAHKNKVGPL